jgi:paraquat-inducible protein A
VVSDFESGPGSAGEGSAPGRIACIECDLPLSIGTLEPGERAHCPRCGHLISTRVADPLTRSLALATTSLLLLCMANAFPFMSLEASGIEKVMTLPRTAVELHREGYTSLAALVLGMIVAVPALMMATVVMLVIPLRSGRPAPWLVPAGRLLFLLNPWSMVEVFVISVLVSLVKIAELAHVSLGLSFWSYVLFGLCFTATLASLDRLTLWQEIERCRG